MLKKNKTTLIGIYTMIAVMMSGIVAFADPGIQTGWIFNQLGLVVLVVSVGLAIMFFIQKSTAKLVITLVAGSLLYILARSPESILSGLGVFIKGLLGL